MRAGLGNNLPHDQATIAWLGEMKTALCAPVIDLLRNGMLAADEGIIKGLSLAAGGRRAQTETGSEQLVPLLSIFSKVSLTPAIKDPKFHRLDDDPDHLTFPIPRDKCQPDRVQYQKRWWAFEKDFHQVKYALTVDTLLVLLEKHFSIVPAFLENGSTTREWVSLYDYAKTAVALICALRRCAAERSADNPYPFLLVGGDLSGVQDFVYSIPSQGALKTLRE